MKHSILLFALLVLIFSCSDSANSETAGEVRIEIDGTEVTEEKIPCDLISEAEIKSICGIPDSINAKIEMEERTYTSCFYVWDDFTYNRVMQVGDMDVDIATRAKMSIVPVKNATEQMFETSTSVYKDGEAISGIGDRAMWGNQMSQLTFLSKGQMIHLHLDVSADKEANKEMALEIAAVLIKNL